MVLTTEQQAAVDARDRDVLVTAGAGSGKTHVLVERYLSLLAGCAVGEIAAVTFTDAAAAEMRQRVRREVMTRPDLAVHRAARGRGHDATVDQGQGGVELVGEEGGTPAVIGERSDGRQNVLLAFHRAEPGFHAPDRQ